MNIFEYLIDTFYKMGSPKKSSEVLHKYGRDYLLQLRMHPLSLQKPQNLPIMEIVKDRLYLHQIDSMASPGGDESQYHHYTDDMYAFMKHDNAYKRFSQRSSPGYTSRSCPEYASYPKYNAPLTISKYRSCYESSPQKQFYRTSCKIDMAADDFFENFNDIQNAPWYKETSSLYTNENEWNLNQKNSENKVLTSNNGCNLKNKKKLSIIDPKTGKNILEGMENSTASQTSISSKENECEARHSVEVNSLMNNECKDIKRNVVSDDDYPMLTTESSKHPSVLSYNPDSSDDEFMKEYSEYKLKASENSSQKLQYEENEKNMDKSIGFSPAGDPGTIHPPTDKGNAEENSRQPNDKADSQQLNDLRAKDPRSGVHEIISSEGCNDTNLKEKILLLRDKIYTMKQEQQKMAILQSFLRFKKQQLDESFRSLDDKKMDIINWEYNLYTKAKKLHEKEYWMTMKSQNLRKKEKQLEEKEKWLDLRENEIRNKYNNVLKREGTNNASLENGEFHGDTKLENKSSPTKNAIDINGEQEGNNCINSSTKDDEILPQKSKDLSSGDICEIQTTSGKSQKFKASDYSTSLNYSKVNKKPISFEGRKYLPEHVKQWFNQRDKNAKKENKH
ncbi:putative leucine-rich repeat-containing protein DDB_G0290503 isoform X1 [Parasteatoda tepidariorum]|uniref:putative leucine-rich repeat-containing protein DDB_G0290503 isoform X1 n=2 Tax=Parasteatoda tepidariorum TaxID=114398 RepID=UPI0039BCBE81